MINNNNINNELQRFDIVLFHEIYSALNLKDLSIYKLNKILLFYKIGLISLLLFGVLIVVGLVYS